MPNVKDGFHYTPEEITKPFKDLVTYITRFLKDFVFLFYTFCTFCELFMCLPHIDFNYFVKNFI